MENCIFCKIVKGEIPCNKVYEDDKVIAFNDINPEAPVHVLVVPKTHIKSIMDLSGDEHQLISHVFKVISEIAKDLKLSEKGFRIVNNIGEDGGQTVPHIHFHILGGRSMQWPPG
ncbi:histidine triad nucleotide-binding protein [Lutispora thermophila]|uniref:Histidine triad (HIT) family protein n=1 Tax=Lutispora thermophila DSM 19022 TaxID=1122184 RepID=A0A1M6DD95_9FIRM|nr:histidine triad nucleotide-binding protein [Lutispora thermophila]SHI70978.1 histidine triad (HIT) family protein [Lutispora thermophila DSM 19022]